MKIKTLFLSGALTAFLLVLIAGVIQVSANSLRAKAHNQPTAVLPTDSLQPTLPAPATATISPYLSPEEAVALASARLGDKDVYSLDTTSLAGMDVYKVTFSSGAAVYISPEGHILTVTTVTRVVLQPTSPSHESGPAGNPPPAPTSTGTSSHHGDDSGGDD